MKWIKYKLNNGVEKRMAYSNVNLTVVQKEAAGGKYEIYDDGEAEAAQMPSQLDIIEAQVTYTAMMTDTLLEV